MQEKITWTLVEVDADVIRRNPKNPKIKNKAGTERLKQSLQKFGLVYDGICNKDFSLIDGHSRMSVSGNEKLRVFVPSRQLSEREYNEMNAIFDVAKAGDPDLMIMEEVLGDVFMEEWNLKPERTPQAGEDNFTHKPIKDIKTEIIEGDMIEIGPHRLLCGDSRNPDHALKLMGGKLCQLLFTSPPYSDMRDYNGGKELDVRSLIDFVPAFSPFANYMIINLGIQRKDNEIFLYWDHYIAKCREAGYKFVSWNVWNRSGSGGSVGAITALFPIEHEWIFVFGKNVDKESLHKIIPNKHSGSHRTGGDRQKSGELVQKSRMINSHRRLGTVQSIDFERDLSVKQSHPATFPVLLPAEFIKAMTNEHEIIVDCFLGSGTSMVAAHQLDRICYGMELDPKYCQVIMDRMKKQDKKIPIFVNGKEFHYKTQEEMQ